jgi:hypothetical protein
MDKWYVTVDGDHLTIDVFKELVVDLENLDKHLTEHCALLAYWESMLGFKMLEVNRSQVLLDRLLAATEVRIRKEMGSDPSKYGFPKDVKVTEGLVQALVTDDQDVVDHKNILNDLKKDAAIIKALVNGYDKQCAILVTLGGKRRAELEAGIHNVINKTQQQVKKITGKK